MSTALENIKTIDIEQWLTLATAPSSTKLLPGQTPYAYNTWVDEKPGSVITANGYTKVGTLPSGVPGTFCINYFNTSAGSQVFVVSDNSTVWTTLDFVNFTAIITGLSPLFQLRGSVIRNKLWLTNGSNPVYTWDGTTATALNGSGGTPNVPLGAFIAYHDERVWLFAPPTARSAVYFSSLTDTSGNIIEPDNANAWDTSDNFLQISEGDADFGTGMILYRGYLHFFKQYSIWRLVGYDEYSYSRVKTRASTGTRFNESIQILDSLVHLIGIDGIYVFDGENTDRISDIIDPSTAEQTAFGFNQLQQPNVNNQFWEVTDTADWNTGTVPTDTQIADAITLAACDDSQADFQAGATQTNLDLITNPGFIQIGYSGSGYSNYNIALGQPVSMPSAALIGVPAYLTDGSNAHTAGYLSAGLNNLIIGVTLPASTPISKVVLRNLLFLGNTGDVFTITFPSAITSVNGGGATFSGSVVSIPLNTGGSPYELVIITFSPVTVSSLTLTFFCSSVTMTAFEIYTTAYFSTAKFTSKTLNLGIVPAFLGYVGIDNASFPAGSTYQLFTQTSSDGVTWDAEVNASGPFARDAGSFYGAVQSALKQYIRWGIYLTSNGSVTPSIDSAFLPAIYISAIHDTGGGIFSWGAFTTIFSAFGQQMSFYYRGATTSGGVSTSAWNSIVSGGALSIPVSYRYIQFKIEISGGDSTHLVQVDAVTINWVLGSGLQSQIYQNVCSAFWRNRYWLCAAGSGAQANNLILIRGKKTFQSPWQLKDWPILSMCRYLDNLYGCSSVDGSIYQLDTGYSANGAVFDSIFQTGDFMFKGFQVNIVEILIEVERSGPYSLFFGTSVDQGQTWIDSAIDLTLASGQSYSYWKQIRNLNLTTDKLRMRFYTNGPDQPWQVHNCVVFYQMSSNRGSIN